MQNINDQNISLKKDLSKIYRESFLFGFLGLLILISSGSFFISIFGYLSLYYIYKSFKSHNKKVLKH